MTITKIFVALSSLIALQAFAGDDGAFLDPKYPNLIHPKVSKLKIKGVSRSDTVQVISFQTEIKSQQSRGTCSIFSATAYIEGLLVQKGDFTKDLDLSEEWLEYTAVGGSISDGSHAYKNFNALKNFGAPFEKTLPYVGYDWNDSYSPEGEKRCGHLKDQYKKKACLLVHFDPALLRKSDVELLDQTSSFFSPSFVDARTEAFEIRDRHFKFKNTSYTVYDTNQVKELLLQGKPVILESDFYYGAWNHRKATELGIERNMDFWNKGIVTHPVPGSMDEFKSRTSPAGHSILVVGFDDEKIVEQNIKMKDGSTKKVRFKGVYYFKNSWGKDSFGRDFEVDGKKFPGYGMMVQDYAHGYGSFYKLEI